MKIEKETPAAASAGASMIISAMVAVAVVLTILWPEKEPPEWTYHPFWLETLAPPAAGIVPQELKKNAVTDTIEWVVAAGQAESWLAEPDSLELQAMRSYLTSSLIGSDRFARYPETVTIDLGAHEQKETIKYLVESRPGVMAVIYYSEDEGKQGMLVYWPEVAGDSLVYTPVSGVSAKAISEWVQEQIASVDSN
jgi:hypothetical protein